MRNGPIRKWQRSIRVGAVAAVLCLASGPATTKMAAQSHDSAQVIGLIDAMAHSRYEHVLGFTDTEVYRVFRGNDETHPVASMTVKTTYQKGVGKNYQIVAQSGSEIFLKFGLHPLLDSEKAINLPGNVEKSWFTSENYEMQVKAGVVQRVNGRDCMAIGMTPRRKAPNMIDGTLWVDVDDDSIVMIDGVASKNPSVFSGTTHMMRDYVNIDGFAMSHHARAESNSAMFGRTVVTIDYSDYEIQLR